MSYKPTLPQSQAALAARRHADLLREVFEVQLVVAIGLILEQRRRRAAGDTCDICTGDVLFDGDAIAVEAFLVDLTPHQLRLLRKIALGIEPVCLGPVS